jgi:hypothetical protein
MTRTAILASWLLCTVAGVAAAQSAPDTRTQYPWLLRNAFISIDVGALSQPFEGLTLSAGRTTPPPDVPRTAVRAVLLGRELGHGLSVQGSYTRPVSYVRYTGVNGPTDTTGHHVRVNFGGVTIRGQHSVGGGVSAFAEGGLGFTSRTGFDVAGRPVVPDVHFASPMVGAGLDYRVTRSLDLTVGTTYVPGRAEFSQPRTLFTSGGVRFTMRPLTEAQLAARHEDGVIFPSTLVQVEYSSGVGYGVNTFLSKRVPVFWGGHALVDQGGALHVQHNVFHTRRVFALDVGADVGTYRTRQARERFATLSAYPLLRFTFLRRRPADVYFAYSLAGPTYISRVILDGLDTGRHFTFQDFMSLGVFAGRDRHLNVNVKINHFSNGNIFTQNAGVKIPLTFGVGYAF